jgi:RNA polymerase sigma factor (sigma-70 family)
MTVDRTQEIRAHPSAEHAWAEWYKAQYGNVYFVAYRYAKGNPEIARELVQETFTRFIAYRCIDKVTTDRHALMFLMKICRNVAIDLHARKKDVVTVGLEHIVEQPVEPSPVPEIEIDQALGMLEPEERRIMQWVRQGERVSDIAGKLGIAYSATGVRIFRITQKLRKILSTP